MTYKQPLHLLRRRYNARTRKHERRGEYEYLLIESILALEDQVRRLQRLNNEHRIRDTYDRFGV